MTVIVISIFSIFFLISIFRLFVSIFSNFFVFDHNRMISIFFSNFAVFVFRLLLFVSCCATCSGQSGEQCQGRRTQGRGTDRASSVLQSRWKNHWTSQAPPYSKVYGPSMLPTLNLTGDVILTEHLSHRFGKIGLGDVVLVRSPRDPNRMVTKRILGLEGHRLTFSADPLVGDDSISVVVPKGHVWIQGDNLYASTDSRHFGPVPYGLIEGKALLRVWPPEYFGSLR